MADPSPAPSIEELCKHAVTVFADQFNDASTPPLPQHIAYAPGRINLIGEHTDYNEGLVLPLAIDRYVAIVARVNHSPRFRIMAEDLEGEIASFMNDQSFAPGRSDWVNHIKGVIERFIDAGHRVPSFDAAICSSLPMGAGLGCSAALTVAAATLIERFMAIRIDPARKARWCRRVEHEYLGRFRGLMDTTIAACAQANHAMFIDCRTQAAHPVPIDNHALAIVVADSRHHPETADEQYHERRHQCAQAVDQLKGRLPDIESLRDVQLTQLDIHRAAIDPIAFKRARHVITENYRVQMAADALAHGEYETLGFLMNESHRFLRDEMQVSCQPIETLVEAALETPGVYGSRITGIGFGGATVTLVQPHAVDALIIRLQEASRTHNETQADCFRVYPTSGAHALGIYGLGEDENENQIDDF